VGAPSKSPAQSSLYGLFEGVLRFLPRNEFRLGGFVRDMQTTCGDALALALATSRR
jgi:hypothetical protein